ncbi:hypothetical protein ACQ86G_20520 [Roseateles chitinivorans]|uniref:hypothetical protein n=1 Tax=Roseateles chitinivorans TaxID=2917965 RepID=UPI003D676989
MATSIRPGAAGSPQEDDRDDRPTSFGVHKPVDHLVISFPSAAEAGQARAALSAHGIADADLHAIGDREMVELVARDLQRASPLAAIGQEINLLRSHGELAERGYHFLVVKAENDGQAREIAEIARRNRAERAQYYGHFIIEEMLEPEGGRPQVAESPHRGLDTHPKPDLPR